MAQNKENAIKNSLWAVVKNDNRDFYIHLTNHFYQAIDGKASLELFILQPIRENICILLAANDIIIIYSCQDTAEL